jgi:hypothetical protein
LRPEDSTGFGVELKPLLKIGHTRISREIKIFSLEG